MEKEFEFDLQRHASVDWSGNKATQYVDLGETASVATAVNLETAETAELSASHKYLIISYASDTGFTFQTQSTDTEGELDGSAAAASDLAISFTGTMSETTKIVPNGAVLQVSAAKNLVLSELPAAKSTITTAANGSIEVASNSYTASAEKTASFAIGTVDAASALILTGGELTGVGKTDSAASVAYGTVADNGTGTVNGTLTVASSADTGVTLGVTAGDTPILGNLSDGEKATFTIGTKTYEYDRTTAGRIVATLDGTTTKYSVADNAEIVVKTPTTDSLTTDNTGLTGIGTVKLNGTAGTVADEFVFAALTENTPMSDIVSNNESTSYGTISLKDGVYTIALTDDAPISTFDISALKTANAKVIIKGDGTKGVAADTVIALSGDDKFSIDTKYTTNSDTGFVLATTGNVTAPGAIKVVKGAVVLDNAVGVSLTNANADTDSVSYAASVSLTDTVIKLGTGQVTLTETGSVGATTVTRAGDVSGLDKGTAVFADVTAASALKINTATYKLAAGMQTATFVATSNAATGTYLTAGTVMVKDSDSNGAADGSDSILVSDGADSTPKTTKIATSSATAFVTVASGKYTIKKLSGDEKITIDGKTYTYTQATQTLLTDEGEGFVLDEDISADGKSVTFNILGGEGGDGDTADTIAEKGAVYLGSIADSGVLATAAASLESVGDKLYFGATGQHQSSAIASPAYTLEKTNDGVTLTAASGATALAVDATGATLYSVDLSATSSDIDLTLDGNSNITSGTLANNVGSTVQVGDGTTVQAVGTASAAQTFKASGGVVTLTGGAYTSAKGVSVDTTQEAAADITTVTIGSSTADAVFGEAQKAAVGSYDTAGVTISSGKLALGSTATRVVNGVTYTDASTATGLTFLGNSSDTAYLVTGDVKKATKDGNAVAVLVADAATGEKTSSVTLTDKSGTDLELSVASGKYTIKNLANEDSVVIDGNTYTYSDTTNALTLTNGTGYLVKNATSGISFTIDGSMESMTDVLDTDTAVTYLNTIAGTGKLKSAIDAIGSDITTTFNFDTNGAQVGSASVYTLRQTSPGAYTLADADGADTGIVMDARGVTGLTLTLSDDGGQDTVLFDADTGITEATFAAGDIISNNATVASATVKAKVTSGKTGTLSVSGGTVTLITGGFDGGTDTVGVSVAAKTTDVVVGNITFDATSETKGTYTDATHVAISEGKVSVAAGETSEVDITAGTTAYTTKKDTATTISYANSKATLTAGTVSLDNSESIDIGTTGTITNNGNDPLEVNGTGTTVTLTGGQSFTTTDDAGYTVKYTANADGSEITVAQTYGGSTTTRVYTATSAGTATVTMSATTGAFDGDTLKELGNVGAFVAVALKPLAEYTTADGTMYFKKDGQQGASTDTDNVITVNASTTPKTVTVTGAVDSTVPIDLTGANAKVTDSGNYASYQLNGSTIAGTSFTVNENIITDAGSAGVSVSVGSVTTSDADAKIDMNGAGNTATVTFTTDTKATGAVVTTVAGKVTLTETGTGTATAVDQSGNVEGLDGDVTVTTVANATTQTTGDGNAAINGRAYTVSGDGNGVTYTASTTGVSAVEGLKTGATLTLGGSFTGYSITVTGTDTAAQAFSGIHSEDGIGITVTSTGYDVTLDKANEAVTIRNNTYKVVSTSDGITVDSATGKVSGLTNGDKVSIIDNTNAVVTYEVADGILTVTDTDGKTATYKQADSSTPFTAIYTAGAGTVVSKLTVTGNSTDKTETAATDGLQIGSNAGAVDTVTNGMLVDKNGNATTDSSKATAKLTITDSDDAIKYEAQNNNAQTITATSGTAATMEWDVTTGSGSDTINIASSKETTIDAGDGKNNVTVGGSGDATVKTGTGNDTILINGTGEALVEVAGGNNTITHTGTGESTLKGGSGNDTFKSSNEADTIIFGDGNNTLNMTANVTNTISDYEFGKDKLKTATTTGTLALDNINVGTDGTIGYGTTAGAEGTAKVGNDGQSVYAATITDADGRNKRNVGWTGAEGGMINATSLTERVVLIGNAEGAKDTLMGGQAGDTIKAGTGASSLWGAAGNDLIISSSESSNEIFFLSGDGKDTVQGFTAYTESTDTTADVLDFFGQGATDIKMTSDGLKIYNGESSMLVSGSYNADTMFQWKGNTGDEVRVAKIGYKDTVNTMTYEDAATDYIGGNGIDTINATSGEVNLWMDGSKGKSFGNIEVINAAGNADNVTIAGGDGKNTLVGGTGDSSLWGGAGKAADVLIGNGQTDFFYNMGGGSDSISGHSGDTVDLFDINLSDLTDATLDTANRRVIFTTTAGDTVTVSGGVDTFKVGGQTWTTTYASDTDWSLKE